MIAHQAVHTALYNRTIQQAWETACLFPWCPQRIANDESKVDPAIILGPSRGSAVSGVVLISEVAMRDLEMICEEKKKGANKKDEQKKKKLEKDLKRDMKQAVLKQPNKQGDQVMEPEQKKKRGRPQKVPAQDASNHTFRVEAVSRSNEP